MLCGWGAALTLSRIFRFTTSEFDPENEERELWLSDQSSSGKGGWENVTVWKNNYVKDNFIVSEFHYKNLVGSIRVEGKVFMLPKS